jgi:hypothetical protein
MLLLKNGKHLVWMPALTNQQFELFRRNCARILATTSMGLNGFVMRPDMLYSPVRHTFSLRNHTNDILWIAMED